MLRNRNYIPLDYSLCQDTVTVYHREGLTRRVLDKVHLELTVRRSIDTGREQDEPGFLLIIPGQDAIAPGDRLVTGIGPELSAWSDTAGFPTVASVRECRFRGEICHMEARG